MAVSCPRRTRRSAASFRRDVSDPQAKDWVVFDLTEFAGAESLTIQARAVEARGVADHTSWVFVGLLTLAVK